MKIKSIALAIICALAIISTCGCGGNPSVADNSSEPKATVAPSSHETTEDGGEVFVKASENFTKFDTRISFGAETDTIIKLADGATEIDGAGASCEGDIITISQGGVYVFEGKLSNGGIVVNIEKIEKAQLVFKGVDITNKSGACIYVMSADKVAITLAEGTENTLTDAANYSGLNEKGEPNACIFSKDDLSINGFGSLTVNGNYNNGIASKNDLKIVSGIINVKAVNNALKGKESFSMNSGILTVNSDDDAIKVNDELSPEKGYIIIEGGELNITAVDDALTAFRSVSITGGKVTTFVGGKAVNCDGTQNIAEGCLIEK